MSDSKEGLQNWSLPEFRKLFKLNMLASIVVENSSKKGFREQLFEGLTDAQKTGKIGRLLKAAIMTINEVGELMEFWESFRKGTLDQPCDKAEKMKALGLPPLTNAAEEIADSIIRSLDRAEAHGIDVDEAIYVKMRYNLNRPHLHGGKLA